jgi:hypothetical protein
MMIRTRNGKGEWIDHELSDEGLAYSARLHRTTPAAVVHAIRTYDDISIELPDSLPVPELARRLEVDGDWALELVADYVNWELEHE